MTDETAQALIAELRALREELVRQRPPLQAQLAFDQYRQATQPRQHPQTCACPHCRPPGYYPLTTTCGDAPSMRVVSRSF